MKKEENEWKRVPHFVPLNHLTNTVLVTTLLSGRREGNPIEFRFEGDARGSLEEEYRNAVSLACVCVILTAQVVEWLLRTVIFFKAA